MNIYSVNVPLCKTTATMLKRSVSQSGEQKSVSVVLQKTKKAVKKKLFEETTFS